MNKYQQIQTELLQQVKSQLAPGKKLVDELAEHLCISSDSAYRRIRLEKTLSLDEIIILADKFSISLDVFSKISDRTNFIPFYFDFANQNFNLKKYLESLLENCLKLRSVNGQLFYSAKDVPIFYHFNYKSLSKFKMLYWLKSMVDHKDFKDITYEDFEIKEEWKKLSTKVYQEFTKLETIEIWNYETTHSNIAQVLYYYETGYISLENAIAVLEDLKSELKDIQLSCVNESKLNPEHPNLKIYYNEVISADNTILAKSPQGCLVFLPHIILNYMTTSNEKYCDYINNVFELVIKQSTLISGINEKERNKFFNYNYKRIDKAIMKLDLND
jgi:hypothetical protein